MQDLLIEIEEKDMDLVKAAKRMGTFRHIFGDKKHHWVLGYDVTNRCNLRCKHCYWWRQKHTQELTNEQMIAHLRELYKKGYETIYVLGGEPMLKPDVVKAAAKIFNTSLIFTNGTLGFPHASTCIWAVSLDGNQKIHNEIRGEGVYQKIMDNLPQATNMVVAHVTINSLNYKIIPEMITNLSNTSLNGIVFSFYFGCKGANRDELFLPFEKRDSVLDNILELKKEYGDFIFATERFCYYFRPDGGYSKWSSKEKCPATYEALCFTSDGKAKYCCPYGARSDCSTCGCGNFPLLSALRDWDLPTIKMTFNWWMNPRALR